MAAAARTERRHRRVTGTVQGVGLPAVRLPARRRARAGRIGAQRQPGRDHRRRGPARARSPSSAAAWSTSCRRWPAIETHRRASAVACRTALTGFAIVDSQAGGAPAVAVSVDVATCADCLAELVDPADRRFGYPFINCTNCGPRYTIIISVPYDRPSTTMAGFLCATTAGPSTTTRPTVASTPSPTPAPLCGPQPCAALGRTARSAAKADDALDGRRRPAGRRADPGHQGPGRLPPGGRRRPTPTRSPSCAGARPATTSRSR